MLCDCAEVNVEKRTTINDGFITTRSSHQINTQARGRDLVMLAYHSLSRSAVTLYEEKLKFFVRRNRSACSKSAKNGWLNTEQALIIIPKPICVLKLVNFLFLFIFFLASKPLDAKSFFYKNFLWTRPPCATQLRLLIQSFPLRMKIIFAWERIRTFKANWKRG